MERSVLFLDVIGKYVRDRGLLQPRSISEDAIALALVTATLAAFYLNLLPKRVAGEQGWFRAVIRASQAHVSRGVSQAHCYGCPNG